MSSLRTLWEDMDLYHRAFGIYHRIADRDNVLTRWVDTELAEIVKAWQPRLPDQEPLKFLSIGPGDGSAEAKILRLLLESRQTSHCFQTTVVEPAVEEMKRFKQRVADQAAQLPGMTFDWRAEKLEDFQAKDSTKFHFICSVHSIYYVPDIQASIKDLYDRLEPGGMMLIMVLAGDTGMGQLCQSIPLLQSLRGPYPNSIDVESAFSNLGITLDCRVTIPVRSDIGFCLNEPPKLSEEGSLLLDFFTHSGHFVRDAPPDLQREVQECLANKCSERGEAGQVLFKGDWRAVVVQKK